jgi:hypothetical protein
MHQSARRSKSKGTSRLSQVSMKSAVPQKMMQRLLMCFMQRVRLLEKMGGLSKVETLTLTMLHLDAQLTVDYHPARSRTPWTLPIESCES